MRGSTSRRTTAPCGSRLTRGSGAESCGSARRGEKREAAAELEELGYSALWIPDVVGDVFGALRDLLDATASVVVATGILNLWMHAADEVGAGFAALERDHPGRALLGIGVSHSLVIEQTHPGQYDKWRALAPALVGLTRT